MAEREIWDKFFHVFEIIIYQLIFNQNCQPEIKVSFFLINLIGLRFSPFNAKLAIILICVYWYPIVHFFFF